MFVPLWLLAGLFVVTALMALVLISRSGVQDMLSQQRDSAPPPARKPTTVDEAALMALPEVVAALQRGNKIEAIKQVRLASGLGLKESKELVERHARR